jgi:hypothetical protein
MSVKSDFPRHNSPIAAVSTSPCLTSGRGQASSPIAPARFLIAVLSNSVPTRAKPACGTNTSSVSEMTNCIDHPP